MTAPTRPGGRTVPTRRFIGGRMNRDSVKRIALESFQLGRRIEQQRQQTGGLGYSMYWKVYSDVIADLSGVAFVEGDDLPDE